MTSFPQRFDDGPSIPPARVGMLAVLLGALAVAVRRLSGRAPRDAEDTAPRPLGSRTVLTRDGVPLHVEIDGDDDAEPTVVFAHGLTARLGEFDKQRAAVADRARLVLYDQRGHGRSGWGDTRRATVDQLGQDLLAVLDATAPTGSVLLVGHSMGGMAVMALAEQHPELFGDRVVGVFLLATSAGDLPAGGPVAFGARALRRLHLLGTFLWWLRLVSPLLDRLRRPGGAGGYAVTRRLLFGTEDADPAAVREVQQMLEETPSTVTAAFAATLAVHDKVAALAALRDVPVLVLDGADDRLTPAAHSRLLAAEIGPGAELVIVPGAGHAVNHTRPEIVNPALERLLDRAQARVPGPRKAG